MLEQIKQTAALNWTMRHTQKVIGSQLERTHGALKKSSEKGFWSRCFCPAHIKSSARRQNIALWFLCVGGRLLFVVLKSNKGELCVFLHIEACIITVLQYAAKLQVLITVKLDKLSYHKSLISFSRQIMFMAFTPTHQICGCTFSD